MTWNDAAVLPSLRVAWDYMRLTHPPERADAGEGPEAAGAPAGTGAGQSESLEQLARKVEP